MFAIYLIKEVRTISSRLYYKGFRSDIYYSAEDQLLCGIIDNIKDLVSFHSESATGIVREFHQAVDEYLELCDEIGRTPEITE